MTELEQKVSACIENAILIFFDGMGRNNPDSFLFVFSEQKEAEKCAYLLSGLESKFAGPASFHLTTNRTDNNCEVTMMINNKPDVEDFYIQTSVACDRKNILSANDDSNIDSYSTPFISCAYMENGRRIKVNRKVFQGLSVLPVITDTES